jgi:alkylation response protein AidB-like acyl-CoA dehydrogenase
MNFEFSEEQRMLRDTVKKVMEKEIIPIASEYDRTKALLDREKRQPLWDKLIPLGYIGGTIPEEHGGAGMDYISYGLIYEELAKAYASLSGNIGIQAGCFLVHKLADDEQRKRFLPGFLTGESCYCTCFTEPNVGSDNSAMETFAEEKDSYYVINGTKTWISNGSISDVALVAAQTKRGSGAKGIALILVDRKESPYTTRELPKLGLRSFPTSEVFFEDCRVPKQNLLSPPGEGLKRIMQLYEHGRSTMAIQAVGMAQAGIDAAIRYAKERTQFGKPIAGFQLIQEMLADMIAETDAARLLGYRALWMLDKGVRCDTEASLAKAYATEAAIRVTSKAIQIHGAYGLSEEYDVERFFRDARSFNIPDGTTQIQKLIVGRNVTGISAFR